MNKHLAEAGVDLDLLKARDGLVRQAASLAVRLRICVSSRTRADTASTRDSTDHGPPPWYFGNQREWYLERNLEVPEHLREPESEED